MDDLPPPPPKRPLVPPINFRVRHPYWWRGTGLRPSRYPTRPRITEHRRGDWVLESETPSVGRTAATS